MKALLKARTPDERILQNRTLCLVVRFRILFLFLYLDTRQGNTFAGRCIVEESKEQDNARQTYYRSSDKTILPSKALTMEATKMKVIASPILWLALQNP